MTNFTYTNIYHHLLKNKFLFYETLNEFSQLYRRRFFWFLLLKVKKLHRLEFRLHKTVIQMTMYITHRHLRGEPVSDDEDLFLEIQSTQKQRYVTYVSPISIFQGEHISHSHSFCTARDFQWILNYWNAACIESDRKWKHDKLHRDVIFINIFEE